jgi:hypothetical protein
MGSKGNLGDFQEISDFADNCMVLPPAATGGLPTSVSWPSCSPIINAIWDWLHPPAANTTSCPAADKVTSRSSSYQYLLPNLRFSYALFRLFFRRPQI